MKPAGLAIAFAGYTLAFFGYYSIKGPGVGFLDVLIPGRPFVPFAGSSSAATTQTGPPTLTPAKNSLGQPVKPGSSSVSTGSPGLFAP